MASLRTYNTVGGIVKIDKVSEQITLVTYKDRESLCKAFLRVEEHYESPEFKDKVFTLGQYRQWYCQRYGSWTYYKDWSGFNIPSAAFKLFNEGLFDPLEPAEQELVDLFKHKPGTFCVIGTFEGGDADVYEHEICHAMFATNDSYKTEVLAALAKYDNQLEALKKTIVDVLGYNESVLLDECHAYVCESTEWLQKKGVSYPQELHVELKSIKQKYKP